MMLTKRLALCGLLLGLLTLGLLAACASGSVTPTATNATGVSLQYDIQPIFNTNCVLCHQGDSPPAGLSLEQGKAYSNLVNVPSTESQLMRVAPGAPDKSYLINKMLGTQAQAGGSGAQMPFNSPPLPQSQVSLIQEWIAAGAPNN